MRRQVSETQMLEWPRAVLPPPDTAVIVWRKQVGGGGGGGALNMNVFGFSRTLLLPFTALWMLVSVLINI